MRSSPRHGLSAASSSGLLAWWVIAIGRVCGTAIGTAPRPITRWTPSRSTTWRTVAANASHLLSGSGPCMRRYGVPASSPSSRTTRRGASYCS